jgi:glucosamine 6-phosphate synthetase-like amidotransferase/phosphosugar isomerase protein
MLSSRSVNSVLFMCSIIGYKGSLNVASVLVDSLKRVRSARNADHDYPRNLAKSVTVK